MRRRAIPALVLAALVGLTACTPEAESTADPEPTASESSQALEPATDAPVLVPDGTAGDNLAFFDTIVDQVWTSSGSSSGRAYIDALAAAGFDKAAMQVTPDLTTVGNPVESMQFSVRWGDAECLIGQVGPSTGEPVTMVMAQLAEGRCLVGNTQPIDW